MKRFVDWLNENPDRRITAALLALCAMIYIPLAGNYGMWDPWETHYGEVARQMLEKNDFISLWWPGSPQDRQEFWSKPVLTFWLMAISMKLAGIQWASSQANEMVATWKVEWASRIPFVLLGIAGIWGVWDMTRRLIGRRAGVLAAVILANSSQWAFITRQAMTDMAFVVPMTLALTLAGTALLGSPDEFERELPRGTMFGFYKHPRTGAFYGLLALVFLTVVPQLLMISIQLQWAIHLGSVNIRLPGIAMTAVYWAFLGFALYWCGRAKNKRQLYMHMAWILCGLATLAKGPAGLALPALVLMVHLLMSGRWKDIFLALELPAGIPLFIATAFPWYHAMLIRHGMGFWNEFIGDNYVRRSAGRHGDRGTFEYYIQYIGYGMFPWSGIVTSAGLWSFIRLRRPSDRKTALVQFVMVWFLVEFAVMTAVATKFHHYILPALPALAILAGVFLDEVLTAPALGDVLTLVFVAIPVTFFCGRDYSAFPPRLLWLFNYDYVNAPGTGRPWPTVALYQDRYEYQSQLLLLAVLATLALVAVVYLIDRARRRSQHEDPQEILPIAPNRLWLAAGAFAIAIVVAILLGPASPEGVAPTIPRLAWLGPTLLMLPFVAMLWMATRGGRSVMAALGACALIAVVWTGFLLDKVLIELSPHWAQKHVIAAYYRNRKGPEEPLIAWQLYWRGENFYTRNEIYKSPNPAEKTVFLGDHNAEKMQAYFNTHPGRRVFFIVERVRFESLRNLLPQASRSSLKVIDESNNKIYLASAQI